jgi:transcription elongation factor Elf1
MKDVQYYEKTDSATQKDYLKLQCNCVLCNSALELKFELIDSTEIKEEANCPQCEIRTRAKIHSLQ